MLANYGYTDGSGEYYITIDTDIYTSTPLAYEVIDGGGGGLSKVQSA